MKPRLRVGVGVLLVVLGAPLVGCEAPGPQQNSNTNWLKACDSADDCGDLVCLCGTCSRSCDTDDDCSGGGVNSCVSSDETAASIVCDGAPPTVGICLPRCVDQDCPEGTSCVAGVCRGTPETTESLAVDPADEHQTLIGFGASLAYDDDFIVSHPEKEALFDAMFADSGIDIIRCGNRQPEGGQAAVDVLAEIVEAATARLGRTPLLFMTAGSPPATLKANGDRYCSNADPDCTLIRDVTGEFDYAAYAEYWRSSLEIYAASGIEPEFVSIQNNANWIPEGDGAAEACKFLPFEGTELVAGPDGTEIEASFPGYAEAVLEVEEALSLLSGTYSLTGPELPPADLEDFRVATESLASLSVNFYQVDPDDIDVSNLEDVRALSEELEKPILQSEVHVEARESAVLIHHALTTLGAGAYMQQGFAGLSDDVTHPVLIGSNDNTLTKHDTYYVLAHYARFTDPGWIRVETELTESAGLATAFLDPESGELTFVVVNPSAEPSDITVVPPDESRAFRVIRTSLETAERMVDLGPLPSTGFVRLPPNSVVTITSRE